MNTIDGELYASKARALAVVAIAPTIAEAEKIAEDEINRIHGQLFHREDIGKADLINRRVQMMQALRKHTYVPL